MKNYKYLIIAICFFSCSKKKPLTFSNINEHILCEARTVFNPEPPQIINEYGKTLCPNYIGMRLGCANTAITSIESLDKRYNGGETKIIYKYNDQNQLVSLSVQSSSTPRITTFKYDKAGNAIEVNDPDDIIKYTYDDSNYVTKVDLGNGMFINSKRNGLVITNERFTKEGTLASKNIIQFDPNYRLISNEYINENNISENIEQNYYDKKGRLVKKSTFGSTKIWKYNQFGLVTTDSLENDTRQLTPSISYEVFEENNFVNIKQTKTYSDSTLEIRQYSFDDKGNWTQYKEYTTLRIINKDYDESNPQKNNKFIDSMIQMHDIERTIDYR